MIRVAISVEGPTEAEFSKTVLATHLRMCGIEAKPVLIGRAGGHSSGGGNVSVARLASEMAHLSHSFDAVTSLVDFYGFRGKRDMTVEELEKAVCEEAQRKICGNRIGVLPYIQKHEFEGLLFSDVAAFSVLADMPRGSVDLLGNIRKGFDTPEDINDNHASAPQSTHQESHSELQQASSWSAGCQGNRFGSDSGRMPKIRCMGHQLGVSVRPDLICRHGGTAVGWPGVKRARHKSPEPPENGPASRRPARRPASGASVASSPVSADGYMARSSCAFAATVCAPAAVPVSARCAPSSHLSGTSCGKRDTGGVPVRGVRHTLR